MEAPIKKSLFIIEKEYLEIAAHLENDELTEDIEEKLKINRNELEAKSIGYAFIIKQTEYDISAITQEIERLNSLKKTQESKLERMKNAISDAMKMYGLEKVESPVMKLSFRSSESVDVVSFEQLPAEYKKSKTTVSVDKVAIKAALKAGKEVPGAIISKNKNLQIK